MKPKDFAGLILLGALWGGSFLFIRVAVPALGPFLLVELRVGLAAACRPPVPDQYQRGQTVRWPDVLSVTAHFKKVL